MSKQIHTSILIKASANEIWKVLMDFENYPHWNPFITSIQGNSDKGARLKVTLQNQKFKPIVLVNEINKRFIWLGKVGIGGLFDGQHEFICEETAEGNTLFHQKEKFKGILVPLLSKKLDRDVVPAFEKMNQALKNYVEKKSTLV